MRLDVAGSLAGPRSGLPIADRVSAVQLLRERRQGLPLARRPLRCSPDRRAGTERLPIARRIAPDEARKPKPDPA
jgi:hypothetical protein